MDWRSNFVFIEAADLIRRFSMKIVFAAMKTNF